MSENRIREPVGKRRSASARWMVGATLGLALTGCATTGAPGGPGGPGATNPPGAAPRPVPGSLADAQVRQLLTADLTRKGWRVIGTTANAAPDSEPNLVYAHLSSASSSGQLVRVWTVIMLSDRQARVERAAAIGTQYEHDCARNQVRPIGRATYYDRLIAARQNFTPITSSTPNPIGQGTVAAQVHSLICASSPSATTG